MKTVKFNNFNVNLKRNDHPAVTVGKGWKGWTYHSSQPVVTVFQTQKKSYLIKLNMSLNDRCFLFFQSFISFESQNTTVWFTPFRREKKKKNWRTWYNLSSHPFNLCFYPTHTTWQAGGTDNHLAALCVASQPFSVLSIIATSLINLYFSYRCHFRVVFGHLNNQMKFKW